MKKALWTLALAIVVAFGATRVMRAEDAPAQAASWEYLHLLIPLDRNLGTYQRSDATILQALQNAGGEGWELVSANEPANGVLTGGRATVEFFLKRRR